MRKYSLGAGILFTLVVSVLIGLLFSNTVQAVQETNKVSITLNKVLYENKGPAETIENTGEIMDDFENQAKLAGVTFTVYEMTEEFWKAYDEAVKEEDIEAAMKTAQKEIQAKASELATQNNKVDEKVTEQDGKAAFQLERNNQDGKYQAYLFMETKSPENVTKTATPMVVVLPIMNKEGKENKDIQLYPKNVVKNTFNKEMTNHPDNGMTTDFPTYSFTIGDKIQYYIEWTVPNDIAATIDEGTKTKFSQVQIKDKMDQVGTTFDQIDKIVLASAVDQDLGLNNFYDLVNETDETKVSAFEVNFRFGSEQKPLETAKELGKYAGQTLRIYYTVTVNKYAVPDQAIQNEATYTFVREGGKVSVTDKAAKAVVGGKHFFKYDAANESKGLAGAEFVLKLTADLKNDKNETIATKGQFVQFLNKEGESLDKYSGDEATAVRYVDAKDKATRFISEENGTFFVKGLIYCTSKDGYAMVETKAPRGYEVIEEETKFTISEGSWGTGEELKATKIANSPAGALPRTGGFGIYAFLMIGGAVAAATLLWNRRSKKPTSIE